MTAVVAIGGVQALPTGVHAQEACTIYEVRKGDTLRQINIRAYGTDDYDALFEANRDILKSPDLIEKGDPLRLPCADGTLPERPVVASAEGAEGAPAAAPQAAATPTPAAVAPAPVAAAEVRILTASGYAPFVDEAALDAGLLTDMVVSSYAAGELDQPPIVFVNDRGAHLRDLIVSGSFGLGYPWVRPDCAQVDGFRRIAPDDALLCEGFAFSNPLYQVTEALYMRAASAPTGTATIDGLQGLRVCRVEGDNVSSLVTSGLVSGADQVMRLDTLEACFAALMANEVDIVPQEPGVAGRVVGAMGLDGQVAQVDGVSLPVTFHMIAQSSDAGAVAALDDLNAGLGELQRTGGWFALVAKHLAN
ncbi:MAG: transporter substrate-binding domain-containing protein [Pseudomonadota bacterium]